MEYGHGVNLTGQFLRTRAAVREFNRRGLVAPVSQAGAKIICMRSVDQMILWAGQANDAASKGGMMLLMKTVAPEAGVGLHPGEQHRARCHPHAD